MPLGQILSTSLGIALSFLKYNMYAITFINKTKNEKTNEITNKEEILFQFDTIQESEFTGKATITSHPTEYGIDVLDYKYKEPNELKIRGIISQKNFIAVLGFSLLKNKADIINKIQENLEKYINGIHAVNIKTKYNIYKDYTLTKYSIKDTLDEYGIFAVDMEFIKIVKLENLAEKKEVKNETDTATKSTGTASKKKINDLGDLIGLIKEKK
ncbi:MAG: hypothetical protein LBF97_00335 [Elusimicrobiota bacterium]|jgi:hypothetical protein|nr:hypothetical protein [Elusimicrobiota bacterium]